MSQDDKGDDGSPPPTKRRRSLAGHVREAQKQFQELTGIEIEGVSGFERSEDGWDLTIEAVELRRIPDTMSLLATYTVELDSEGEIRGYRRTKRYTRGRSDAP